MSSSHDGDNQMAVDSLHALATAFEATQTAIEALDPHDDMRIRVLDDLLKQATSAVQKERPHRGNKPSMADRWFWTGRLGDHDARKPLRANAYDAMEVLLALVWPTMTSTERSHRLRKDPEKCEAEQARNTDAKNEALVATINRENAKMEARLQMTAEDRMREQHEMSDRHDREEHAKEWLGVCTIFRRCSLGRLCSDAVLDALRANGVLPSLFEAPSAIPPLLRGTQDMWSAHPPHPRAGLLAALTDFLNGETSLISQLGVTSDEAAVLHRALALECFARFVSSALSALEIAPPSWTPDGGLSSAEQLGEALYELFRHDEGRWRADLDLADSLGFWQLPENSEHACRQEIDRILHSNVLCEAAGGLLRFALTHHCMRAVLTETLSRPIDTRGCDAMQVAATQRVLLLSDQGVAQMVGLLRNPSMGIKEGHFNALVWFLGRMEQEFCGRLWARFARDATDPLRDPMAPQMLCRMAHGSPDRVLLLTEKLFSHSVILREPVRILMKRVWPYVQAQIRTAHARCSLEGDFHKLVRSLCGCLLPVAIGEHGRCMSITPYLSDALLLALKMVAEIVAIGDREEATADEALAARNISAELLCVLRTDLHLEYIVPREHECLTCLERANMILYSNTMTLTNGEGWDVLIAHLTDAEGTWKASDHRYGRPNRATCLETMSRDALRVQIMARLGLTIADVVEPAEPQRQRNFDGGGDLFFYPRPEPVREAWMRACQKAHDARGRVDDELHALLKQQCPHDRWCPACELKYQQVKGNRLQWWYPHDIERRDVPAEAVLVHLLGKVVIGHVDGHLSRPRPPSPLPPALPSSWLDSEPACEECEKLPSIGGDAWHADPRKHQEEMARWEGNREYLQARYGLR